MFIDWTEQDRPWVREGKYYYTYDSDVFEPTDAWENRLRELARDGLLSLADYYNKDLSDEKAAEFASEIGEIEFVVSPRQSCVPVKVLVYVDKNSFDGLPDLDFSLDGEFIVTTNTVDFAEKVAEVGLLLDRYESLINSSNFSLYQDNLEIIKFTRHFRIFKQYPNSISNFCFENEVFYDDTTPVSLSIIFTKEKIFSGLIYDDEDVVNGRLSFQNSKQFRSKVANSLIINLDKVYEYALIRNKESRLDSWREFFEEFTDLKVKKGQQNDFVKEFGERYRDNLYAGSGIPSLYQSRRGIIEQEIENFKDIYGPYKDLADPQKDKTLKDFRCGEITPQDAVSLSQKLYKIQSAKEFEDTIIDNEALRVRVLNASATTEDFVGDRVVSSLFEYAPGSVDDMFEQVFNRISMEELAYKVLNCIIEGVDIDLQRICIDLYNPLVFDLPELPTIDGVWDAISELIKRAILFAIQEILLMILKTILEALRKCESGQIENLNENSAEDYFGPNADAADRYLTSKVFDNLQDMENARSFLDQESALKRFLEQIASLLTPLEFCALVKGEPSEEVLDIVLCVAARFDSIKDRLDTKEEVLELFSSLSVLVNPAACNLDGFVDPPEDSLLCKNDDQTEARRLLLEVKGVDDKIISTQIEKAETRRQKRIEEMKKFFDQDGLQGERFLPGGANDFVLNTIPTVGENEELKHMITISVDAVFNPVRDVFASSVFGSDSVFADVQNNQVRKDYRQDISSDQLVRKLDKNTFRISQGASAININVPNGSHGFGIQNNAFNVLNSNSELPDGILDWTEDSNWRSFNFNNILNNKPLRKLQTTSTDVVFTENEQGGPVLSATENAVNISTNEEQRVVIGSDTDDIQSPASNFNFSIDWTEDFENIVEFVFKYVSSTDLIFIGSDQWRNSVRNLIPVSGEIPVLENCWQGANVTDTIVEKFIQEEAETRETDSIRELVITGAAYLYARIISFQFILQNFALIGDFKDFEILDNFSKQYIENRVTADISQYVPNNYIDSVSDLIDGQRQEILNEFKKVFSSFVVEDIAVDRPNIEKHFMNSLEIVEDENATKINQIDDNTNWYLKLENVEDEEYSLTLVYIKSDAEIKEVIDVVSASGDATLVGKQGAISLLKEKIISSEEFTAIFNYCLPLNDILSIVTIYNVLWFRNREFDDLLDSLKFVMENIQNSDNFTFEPNSEARASERNLRSTGENERIKSDSTRRLSLPWIFDLGFLL